MTAQNCTNQALINPTVTIIDNEPTTTSRQVATFFGKQHKDVLRAINNLECSKDFNQRNFAPITYKDSKNREYPEYQVTKDGFVFLAMGFTGRKAAQLKEAYINEFNRMAATLNGVSTEEVKLLITLKGQSISSVQNVTDWTLLNPEQFEITRAGIGVMQQTLSLFDTNETGLKVAN